jgi:4-hydroxythreonine-4-phosphate dehydrogenase
MQGPLRIGLTAGDPAGIGLEVLLRALGRCLDRAHWVLFADEADALQARARFAPDLIWEAWGGQAEGPGLWLSPTGRGPALRWGHGSPESGGRALAALDSAAGHAGSGALEGIVTAPLSKRWAGAGFTGQTEYLRDRAGVPEVAMSFFAPSFRVVLATTHLSVRDALDRLSVPLYVDLLRLADRELRRFGFPQPRIAVAGVNPHAGEGGAFGSEEARILAPAVAEARDQGLEVSGPWPADSCYSRAAAGEFDVVVAPFHDQGLIPVKLISGGAATNVTLGLPWVRTSPDHGTAFEIAGRGVARVDGMASALECALDLIRRTRSGPGYSAQSAQSP